MSRTSSITFNFLFIFFDCNCCSPLWYFLVPKNISSNIWTFYVLWALRFCICHKRQFLQGRFLGCFWGFVSSFLKYKKFFKLGTRKFHIPKFEKLFKSGFYISCLESYFLKCKKFFRVSVSWNIRKFHFCGFCFPKYQKSFLWRKYKKFLNIRQKVPFPEM